jgi:hypothetical protein
LPAAARLSPRLVSGIPLQEQLVLGLGLLLLLLLLVLVLLWRGVGRGVCHCLLLAATHKGYFY